MRPIKEKKIGEKFSYRGRLLETCKAFDSCLGCYFRERAKWKCKGIECTKHHKCLARYRKDNTRIIYRWIDEVTK